MSSGGATHGAGARWFVRAAAVIVGLVNLRVFVLVIGPTPGGDGSWLLGADISFADALPSVIAVMIAALATSELSLRRFRWNIVSEDYALRYAAAFRALCAGGALAGALLAGLWAVDGTVGAAPPAGYFSNPVNLLGAVAGSWRVGILGAAVGGFFGFLEGALLAFPLAAALGRFGDGGDAGEASPVRPSGAV